mgnify:CR=1
MSVDGEFSTQHTRTRCCTKMSYGDRDRTPKTIVMHLLTIGSLEPKAANQKT